MLDNREIVTLHFGQAGIQMGNAIWETMVAEHGVLCNGKKDPDNDLSKNFENAIHTLFHQAPSGQYIPRSLIVDTEPTVVDEIRTGYYRNLFHPDLLQSGIEDASNNFARGYYSLGRKMLTTVLEKVRFIIESCTNFKGFTTYASSGGGTGSGLYSLLIERIMLEYCGKFCIGSLVLPGMKLSDSIVEPYNTILRISQSLESTDLNLLIDNESIYKICTEKLELYKPTYNNINRVLSPIFSSITAPFRFGGPMSGDLLDMTTNLVPYPKMNFPSLSYSPFLSSQNYDHALLTSDVMTSDVFHHDHSLLNLDIKRHKIMSSYLVYRGNHRKIDITRALDVMKRHDVFHWVDWCPTGFKVAQSFFPPVQSLAAQTDKSVLLLCNNSGIINHFEQITLKFRRLFMKRCFIHWYVGEGMEYDELSRAYQMVSQLGNNYESVCQIEKSTQDKIFPVEKELSKNLSTKVSESLMENKNVADKVADTDGKEKIDEGILHLKDPISVTSKPQVSKEFELETRTPTISGSVSKDTKKDKKKKDVSKNKSETVSDVSVNKNTEKDKKKDAASKKKSETITNKSPAVQSKDTDKVKKKEAVSKNKSETITNKSTVAASKDTSKVVKKETLSKNKSATITNKSTIGGFATKDTADTVVKKETVVDLSPLTDPISFMTKSKISDIVIEYEDSFDPDEKKRIFEMQSNENQIYI